MPFSRKPVRNTTVTWCGVELLHAAAKLMFTCCLPAANPAAVAAIFYFAPNFFPFFAPAKRSLTNDTDFFRQIFFPVHHTQVTNAGNFCCPQNRECWGEELFNSFLKRDYCSASKCKYVCFRNNQVCRLCHLIQV